MKTTTYFPGKHESDLHLQHDDNSQLKDWQEDDIQALNELKDRLDRYSEENGVEIWGDEIFMGINEEPTLPCMDIMWVTVDAVGGYMVQILDQTGRPLRTPFFASFQTITEILQGTAASIAA